MPTKGLTVALLLWAAGARAGDEAAVRPCSEVRDAEARASEEVARCTPYTPPMYLRLMLGGGAVPYVNGAFGELTFDASYSSFSGNQARGGAFSSGVSISLAGAFDQRWVMVVAGLFIAAAPIAEIVLLDHPGLLEQADGAVDGGDRNVGVDGCGTAI